MSIQGSTAIRRRKRRGCNEDCIRRIASHLCQLDSCCSDQSAAQTNNDSSGCCSSSGTNVQAVSVGVGCADACCPSPSAQLPIPEAVGATKSGFCSSSSPEVSREKDVSCCGPSSPADDIKAPTQKGCCSSVSTCPITSCCEENPSSNVSTSSSSKDGDCTEDCCFDMEEASDPLKSTCSGHFKTAWDRYKGLLRLGRCLCLTIKEQLDFCCCAPTSCGSKTGLTKGAASCPEKSKCSANPVSCKQPCCKKTEVAVHQVPVNIEKDVESDAAREHVVIGVSGMTCTGCSRKMMNALDQIPGISGAKVTFVTESAEFRLDTRQANVEQTLRRIERETGFKLSRIATGFQTLDILLPGVSMEDYARHFAESAITIERYAKKVYRVTYDPHRVGARSLLIPGSELAPHAVDPKEKEGRRRLLGTAISFAAALVLTLPIVVLKWGQYNVSRQAVSIVSLVLATLVQAISIPEFYVGAVKSLVYSRVIEMDMLVVLGISAAYLYSVVAFILELCGVQLEQGPFFETAALLITLVLLGRLLSAYARVRAVSAVAMRGLQSKTAMLLLPDGITEQIDARLHQFGDCFHVNAHSHIVTDGIVFAGNSAVDESMITGESVPVPKQPGDKVVAGTLNGPAELDCELTRLPQANSISDIANLVESAVESKPKVQDLADTVASYFIPCVVAIGVVVFAIWIGVAIRGRGQDGGKAVGTAITYAIAVLAVSCPCALGLAVPMVLVIAGGVAAKAGVVIKASLVVEKGYQATDVVFDKTGTITTGELQVATEHYLSSTLSKEDVVDLVVGLVEGETHPVSVAVSAHLAQQHASRQRVELHDKSSKPGLGIQAELNQDTLKAGNPYWLGVQDHPIVAESLRKGLSSFCLTLNNELILAIGLSSTLREAAAAVIRDLHSRKVTCHIVSGDNPLAVQRAAESLAIPSSQIAARSSPASKREYVARLQQSGRIVLFIGDGTNDAVAIAQATVGMQMGTASDVTGAVADVVLLGGLHGVVQFLDVSRRAFRRIWFNFAWAAIYNVFAILLAAGALVSVRIPPAYAGLGEIVSIAPVILAALTLTLRSKW